MTAEDFPAKVEKLLAHDLDPAAIMAEHRNAMVSRPRCNACAEPWPCVTYRLAEAYEGYPELTRRLSELLRGVADALNGPPPPLTWWDWSDLPEKATAARQVITEAGLETYTPNGSEIVAGQLIRQQQAIRAGEERAARAEAKLTAGRTLPGPGDACQCTWSPAGFNQPVEVEYEPSCPEHSEHVYDPRTGAWELRNRLRAELAQPEPGEPW